LSTGCSVGSFVGTWLCELSSEPPGVVEDEGIGPNVDFVRPPLVGLDSLDFAADTRLDSLDFAADTRLDSLDFAADTRLDNLDFAADTRLDSLDFVADTRFDNLFLASEIRLAMFLDILDFTFANLLLTIAPARDATRRFANAAAILILRPAGVEIRPAAVAPFAAMTATLATLVTIFRSFLNLKYLLSKNKETFVLETTG
jgi:hypothetical protein